MALPKNKKVSEYNQEELNEYCQILFDKSGKPATRGPCKNWTGGKGVDLATQAKEFEQKKKQELEEQILLLRKQIDEIGPLTEKFLKDPNHFDYQLFLENSEIEGWNEENVKKLISGEVKGIEKDIDGTYGRGLEAMYRTKNGGLAIVKIEASSEPRLDEELFDLQEIDMDSVVFENGIGSDIFPGFYDESRQEEFERDFIQELSPDERETYEAMKEELSNSSGTDFYKKGHNIPENQKALCAKIRSLRFKANFSNDDFIQTQKDEVNKRTKDLSCLVQDNHKTDYSEYSVSDLEEDVQKKCAEKLEDYRVVDFSTNKSNEEVYLTVGANAFDGSIEVFNRFGELVEKDSCGGFLGDGPYDAEGAMANWLDHIGTSAKLDF